MLNFQEMIAKLTQFWAEQGCLVHQGYDLEVGAGTFNPATFLRALGPEPYAAVYVEPSRRPKDGRYGDNPNRLQSYFQMQVVMKPSPPNIQDLYIQSLKAIGLNLHEHDIRFVHDDWENPTIGAWGLGWEVWIDGMEMAQFTYFQAVGGLPVKPVTGEITFGLERLAMYLQGVDSIFDLKWNETVRYGDIYKRSEWEWSHYNFHEADTQMWLTHFEDFEREAKRLIAKSLPLPAYDFVIKTSHAFNILDARGLISVTERTGYISRIRLLAKELAEAFIKSRQAQNFPLMRLQTPPPRVVKEISTSKMAPTPNERQDFLLEIGSEELPHTFVPIGMKQLEKAFAHLLQENHLPYEKVEVFGTPRRLAVIVKQLAGGTTAQTIEKKGPALQQAYNEQGAPTPMGEGFFRSLGIGAPKQSELSKHGVEIRPIKGIDYLFATVTKPGVSTRQLLAEALPLLILGLEFPKKMRWGSFDIEYPRPLRWIVALFGKEEIPFALADIVSDKMSFGHRQLAPQPFPIESASHYVETLRKHEVMVDPNERKELILNELQKIEKERGARAAGRERVLNEVLYLVEKPHLGVATFDAAFLQAPSEVLISEMVEHQKYFPLFNQEGSSLQNAFIVTSNNKISPKILAGNQKALAPRLADGLFLYQEDLKVPLEKQREKLTKVIFQKELGSIAAKVERITSIVKVLHAYLGVGDLQAALRGAALCKADLTTLLVQEFPDLQGVIGRHYALKAGEKPAVAACIEEHYYPKGEKAPLPETPEGTLVSLAEKFDNLVSCFALGMIPSSSADPYALRRQGLGIVRMVLQKNLSLPLKKALHATLEVFLQNKELTETVRKHAKANAETLVSQIEEFLLQRARTVFADMQLQKDEVEAVLDGSTDDLYDRYCLGKTLHAFRQENKEQFLSILNLYTRAKKIMPKEQELLPLHPENFTTVQEKSLYEALQSQEKALPSLLKSKHYKEALHHLVELSPLLSNLFDHVKILDDDPQIQKNRLALVKRVFDLCCSVIDFSKLQVHDK